MNTSGYDSDSEERTATAAYVFSQRLQEALRLPTGAPPIVGTATAAYVFSRRLQEALQLRDGEPRVFWCKGEQEDAWLN